MMGWFLYTVSISAAKQISAGENRIITPFPTYLGKREGEKQGSSTYYFQTEGGMIFYEIQEK